MFFSWAVRCFLWTSILHSSYQYQSPGGSYSVMQDNFSPMSYPRSCACPDKDGKMYNLESLGSKDRKHPRFSVKGAKYRGYSYSYNPCIAFHLGPKNSSCQKNVAICWWVVNLTESGDTYKTIGIQRGANCGYDDDQDKTPIVVYPTSNEFQNRTSIVKLKCAEGRKDTATFKILDEDNWKFQLTNFWDSCTAKSTQDPESSTSVPPIVVGAVGGVIALTGLIYAVRYFLKKRNNNNEERERILGNANVIHNQIEGLIPANRSQPSPIGSSHRKADVNVLGSVHS